MFTALTAALQQPAQANERLAGFGDTPLLDAIHFSPIIPAEQPRILAIDGGNAELFSSPAASLQLLRFGAVRWHGTFTRMREEWLAQILKTPEGYTATLTPRQGSVAFPMHTITFTDEEQALLDGGFRGNIGRLGNVLRKLGELQYAKALLQQETVLLDGNLQTANADVEKALLQLLAHAEQSGSTIVGFAKTADLFTTGSRTITSALAERGGTDAWVSDPLAVIRTAKDISMRFGKFHANAQYLFRIDSFATQAALLSNAVRDIATAAVDPTFYGYPYPLIAVDQLARISREEQEQLQMELIAKAGPEYPILRQAANALNAHAVLDHMR